MWLHVLQIYLYGIGCQYQYEKAKQDDALSDLSNILGDLKGMAVDMGSELDRSISFFYSLHILHDCIYISTLLLSNMWKMQAKQNYRSSL